MKVAFLGLTALLLLSLAGGLVRVVRGPSPADRMLAAQLMGTTATAMLLLVSVATRRPELVDLALVFALLGALASLAFAEYGAGDGDGAPSS